MQAVILAAGKGTRLHPITKDLIPKPMVRIGGKPILEYIFKTLPDKVDEVILIIGHKGEVIKDYFGDSFGDVLIKYVENVEPKGTGYALMQARPFLRDGCFLSLSGDDLYHPTDLEKLATDNPTILVQESKNPERFGACVVDEEGVLCEILEKRENPPTNLINIGAYLLNHEIFDVPFAVLPNGELNLAEQIGDWSKKRPVQTIQASFWQPINNKEEFQDASKLEDFLQGLF